MINSYGQTFFHDFKYLSDSRRRWREPVEEIIRSGTYDRLHILTHAFWYHKQRIHHRNRECVYPFRKCGTLWTDAGKYHRLGEHCDEGSVFMKIKEILDFLQTARIPFLYR